MIINAESFTHIISSQRPGYHWEMKSKIQIILELQSNTCFSEANSKFSGHATRICIDPIHALNKTLMPIQKMMSITSTISKSSSGTFFDKAKRLLASDLIKTRFELLFKRLYECFGGRSDNLYFKPNFLYWINLILILWSLKKIFRVFDCHGNISFYFYNIL